MSRVLHNERGSGDGRDRESAGSSKAPQEFTCGAHDQHPPTMLRLTSTPATSTQAATPVLRMQLTSRSNLAVAQQRATQGLTCVEELPREVAMTALRDASAMGYRELVLEGGEPLLHRGLCEILTRAQRHSLRTTLVTNGTLLHQARRLHKVATLVDRVAVELHGIDEVHDLAVQREGAFARTIENLALLRDVDLAFELRFALTAANHALLPAVLQLAAAQGAVAVDVHSSWEGGLDDDVIAATIDEHRPLAEHLGLQLRSDLIDRDELMLFRGHYVPTPSHRHLASVVPTLVVEPTGRVRPLDGSLPDHLLVGNLHTARLTQLAPVWLRSDRPRRLVAACDRAWWSAVSPEAPRATRWADELTLHIEAPAPRPALIAA